MIEYSLPIWNGVTDAPLRQIEPLKIDYSDYKGLYQQTNKRIISYDEEYNHMTPLEGSDYIKRLRKGKIDWIVDFSSNFNNILEIGGGDSFNFPYFECRSYTIVDPSIKLSQSSDKLIFIKEYFSDATLNQKYDAILMLNVLEHVDDIDQLIYKSSELLNDKGSIFVSIPILDKRLAIGDFNVLVHEHISYFTFCGAKELFMKYGLEIQSFYNKNETGFFRLTKNSQLNRNINSISPYPLEMIKKNYIVQLDKFISLLKSKDQIIFYGATNGLNNLFYLASNETDIDYEKYRVTDSDKTKWGKYIDCHELPILSTQSLDHYKTVCISALSFYDEIVKNIDNNKIIISTGSL